MSRKDDIVQFVQRHGPSRRADVAEEFDIKPNYAGKLLAELAGENPPRLRRVVRDGTEVEGLYTLPDDSHTSNVSKTPTVDGADTDLTSLIESTVEMQIHTDARVAAGDGRVVHPTEATRNVEVPRGFLSEIIGFRPPQKIGIMRAEGDSMKPTIQDEELVIYEPLDDGITSSGVYVLHMMGGLRVKRVQPFSDGSFRLISDNDYDGYEDEVLIPSDSEDELIREATGRVAEMYPVGRVLFPRRNTDEMHVKQVSAIIDRLVGGDVDANSLR